MRNNEMVAALKKNGFTLIELMIAITIIAVLATVGLVMYTSVQKNARVAKRLRDLDAMKVALESYKTATGFYPPAGTAGTFVCTAGALGMLVPNYMPSMPADPLDATSSGTNCYEYTANATTNATEYKIRTKTALWAASGGEMNTVNYATQPNYIDPAQDGTVDCVVQTGGSINYKAWMVYSGSATTCAY